MAEDREEQEETGRVVHACSPEGERNIQTLGFQLVWTTEQDTQRQREMEMKRMMDMMLNTTAGF